MTAFALVTGTLFREPKRKVSKAGKAYAAATLKVVAAADGSADFWSVLAFGQMQDEMLRLGAGDKLSAQGAFKVEPYVARDGATKISRTLFADALVALRPTPRERRPRGPPDAPNAPPPPEHGGRDFDDEIPL